MKLPLLLSVPHAGLTVPPEVASSCLLTPRQITEDSDEGAAAIYLPLQSEVAVLVTSEVARAIVDLNRAESDRRRDGVVKTHTCWDVPVYRQFPSEEVIDTLLERYYRPYHRRLAEAAEGGAVLGVDCHTMAAMGPPVGPLPGEMRPDLCLSNAAGTCPPQWFESFAACLEQVFDRPVSRNFPFTGGHIIRHHSRELPWMQLELSRAPFLTDTAKGEGVIRALSAWCRTMGFSDGNLGHCPYSE